MYKRSKQDKLGKDLHSKIKSEEFKQVMKMFLKNNIFINQQLTQNLTILKVLKILKINNINKKKGLSHKVKGVNSK